MKIGVIDTDASFEHEYFADKYVNTVRFNSGYEIISDKQPLSHAEYVCATILHENPRSEILLHSIVGQAVKNSGDLLFKSIQQMAESGVALINISLGIEEINFEEIQRVCEIACKHQIFIVAAHSNNDVITYPAAFKNVLGVKKNCGNNKQFFHYDDLLNNIIFHNCDVTSCVQLNQEHLLKGNSFLTARITGILSNYINNKTMEIYDIVHKLEYSKMNIVPDFDKFKMLKVICFTNRMNDKIQVKYAKECLNCEDIVSIEKLEFIDNKKYSYFDVCVIDINNYSVFLKYKQTIIKMLHVNKFKHFFMRYPFFNFGERLYLYELENLLVEQLFL